MLLFNVQAAMLSVLVMTIMIMHHVSKFGDGVYTGRSHRQTPVGVVPV
jgi:hypothetical protein